jgi:Zn-dependent protease with chaperone function
VAKKILRGLQAISYEHPFDRRALASLKGTPGIETFVRKFNEHGIERFLKIQYTGSNLRVTHDNFPEVHDMVREAGRVLDMSLEPEIYIQEGAHINALTAGVERPVVVLNAGCIDHLSADELFFVIGHELGHIKSGHVLYRQMGALLPLLGELLSSVLGPLGVISTMIEVALLNWQRMSELTADRAGLLACQNRDASISAMIKMAGLPQKFYDRVNVDDFIAQAHAFKELDHNPLDRIVKIVSIMGQSHPWTVLRAAEFDRWTSGEGYDRILNACTNRVIDEGQTPHFCSFCRGPLLGDETFCPACGKPVAGASSTTC